MHNQIFDALPNLPKPIAATFGVDAALVHVAQCVSQSTTTRADVESYRYALNTLLDAKIIELEQQ
jgi:hypothetical protein